MVSISSPQQRLEHLGTYEHFYYEIHMFIFPFNFLDKDWAHCMISDQEVELQWRPLSQASQDGVMWWSFWIWYKPICTKGYIKIPSSYLS